MLIVLLVVLSDDVLAILGENVLSDLLEICLEVVLKICQYVGFVGLEVQFQEHMMRDDHG